MIKTVFLIIVHLLIFKSLIRQVTTSNKNNNGNLERIKQFREIVEPLIYPNDSLVHNFIRDNIYIQNWLKKTDFNINSSVQCFVQYINWRNMYNVDRIGEENWEYFKSEYPMFTDRVDKVGRPVVEVWLSDWNIKRAIVSGHRKGLVRWTIYLLEMTQRRLSEIRQEEKRIVSGAVEIIDLGGYNTRQQGCSSCNVIFTGMDEILENYYPGIWDEMYMVNAGAEFRMFLTLMNKFKNGNDSVLKIYSDEKEWLPVLEKVISPDQRSVRFGGNIQRNYEE